MSWSDSENSARNYLLFLHYNALIQRPEGQKLRVNIDEWGESLQNSDWRDPLICGRFDRFKLIENYKKRGFNIN